ncbi:hypothetical protein Ctob_008176, partial [Chrysochromulina tobinii]
MAEPLVRFTVINETPGEVQLLWINDETREEVSYTNIRAGQRATQQTFPGHEWHCRTVDGGVTLVECKVHTDLSICIGQPVASSRAPAEAEAASASTTDGFYHHCVRIASIPVRAHVCVSVEAVQAAADVIGGMLRDTPADVLVRMRAAGCTVAVIGRAQLTSDVPEHRFLSAANKGDWTARRDDARHLLLVPERDDDAPRFGRALPADSAAPLFASERLKKRLEDAVTSFGGCSHLAGELTGQHGDSMVINRASVESVRNQGTTAECPRTITDGVHPGTKCRKTGKAPIHGWRYESTDRDADPHDLSAAAYAELDSTARAAYVRRAPVAYAPLEEPTDEDDGHLTLALPGSRRALAMLLQGDAELQLSGNGHDVGDDDVCSTILKLRGQTDSRFLLAEYLELTCKLELDEHAASADVVLDCLFDDDDAESMTSTEAVRIFRAITQRWPKYTCTGQDKSLGVSGKCSIARSLRAQLPRLLKRIMMNEDEDEAKEKGEQGQDGLQDEAAEEAALLEALAPWGATHSAADIARIAPCLRLDLLPLATVAEHVFTPGRLLSAASIDDAIGRPLREALSDAL